MENNMSRVIKFRYYNSKLKKIVYLPEGILNKQENLMQYTGYTFNDVEFYEGDIIRVKHGDAADKVGKITYESGEFRIEGEYCKHQYFLQLDEDTVYEAEILGNVFENPDFPLSGGCWID